MDIKSTLEQAGLSGNESKVYLALLDLGSALAGDITKRSGINRTNVYDALERLTEKGLVSYVIKANRKYFEASSPEAIIRYLEEQQNNLEKKKTHIKYILPEIEARRKLSKEPQEATIYKGKKGLRSVAEDVLKTKQELLAFGAEGKFVDTLKHYTAKWHKIRAQLKIPIKIIFNERVREKKTKAGFKIIQMRFSTQVNETPATTWIYDNKVAIIVWSDQPLITLIRSKEVADSYRQFFNVLWNSSKE